MNERKCREKVFLTLHSDRHSVLADEQGVLGLGDTGHQGHQEHLEHGISINMH